MDWAMRGARQNQLEASCVLFYKLSSALTVPTKNFSTPTKSDEKQVGTFYLHVVKLYRDIQVNERLKDEFKFVQRIINAYPVFCWILWVSTYKYNFSNFSLKIKKKIILRVLIKVFLLCPYLGHYLWNFLGFWVPI